MADTDIPGNNCGVPAYESQETLGVAAPVPTHETERLLALHRYCVLDTPSEAAFDDIAALAASICGAPIAMVSLVAEWREIPSEALEQEELREALIKALNALPQKYRTVLVLRDVQQLSINETAQVLGISEANVKTRLSRARLQMRDALAPGFDGAWNKRREHEMIRPF